MAKITLEVRTQEFKEVFVKKEDSVARLDNVLNTLTVLLCTEKPDTIIPDQETAKYLLSQGLITPSRSGCYTMKDRDKCEQFSNALSDYMDQLLNDF